MKLGLKIIVSPNAQDCPDKNRDNLNACQKLLNTANILFLSPTNLLN